MASRRAETRTGGRPATTGTIAGDFALSVGMPDRPAPEGWRWTKIADVARLETGHTPSRKHPEYWGGNIPWIGIKDATGNHGQTIYDTIQHTNELGIANSSARILPEKTVCLSRTASVGYVVVMGRPMATSQDFVNWVCSPQLDHRFLKYVLLSEQSAFLRFASGTTHQTIYFPEVKAFHVCLPPPAEQGAIGHILQTLDDKIELNRRMSETLDAMARAIFKKGLDQDSKEHRLDDLCEIFDGPHATPRTVAQGPVFLGISNLSDGLLDLSDTRHVTEDDFVRWTKRVTPATGDIVFSYETRLGQAARIPKGLRCCLGRRMGLLRAKKEKISPAILLYAYLSPKFQDTVRSRTIHGSTVDRIPLIEMGGFPVVVPGFDTERRIAPILECLRERIEHGDSESRTLAALRDGLLPKLISGELRVEDAETFLDRVL